ncbi:hypothetical protein [Herminiimonas contaminans]|uniref:Secreted protein with PEP-CTERM sorting signal n=1 Tax=Herminiimonas contaminans TaxID=1111140 RepID=A0ABS0EQ04_9BURK|nr:hypothetical protein [Herminiimonas contaminans]MBF8176932.1 hypothetical protein [Herminiimonas contaminans]
MIQLVISMLAALVIVIHGIFFVINNMNRFTPCGMRFAWILITAGGMAELLIPIFYPRNPSIPETILVVGIAVFILAERRERIVYRRPL